MNDGEQDQKIKGKGTAFEGLQRYITNVSDVLSTAWLRCIIQTNDGIDRFVLGSRHNLLLNFRLFLVGIWLTYETLKRGIN